MYLCNCIYAVECPNPLPRICAEWTITVTAKDRYAGNTGILNCPASHSLIGNGSITCMEDGKWSPMNAICNICVIYSLPKY